MQALLRGILNTHVSALCRLRAAFTVTRSAALVLQVGAARQARLLPLSLSGRSVW